MRKKTYNRMLKKIHEINEGPLSTPILIQRLLPLELQPNYNKKLREWFGPKEFEIVADTSGEITAYKESEKWEEIGTIGIHDYKCKINDNLGLNIEDLTKYTLKRKDNDKEYNIVYYREFIGEVHIGLRPLMKNV